MKWALKQRRVGKFIGGLKELLARVTFYISIVNFIQVTAMTYYTTVRNISNISFIIYILILAMLILAMMVFEYTIVMPSHYAFLNWQTYIHDNPIRRDLEKVMAKLEEIEKKLEEKRNNQCETSLDSCSARSTLS